MFRKYPSIENSYREEFIQSIEIRGIPSQTEWQVFEKIHGANFGFICSSTLPQTKKNKKILKAIKKLKNPDYVHVQFMKRTSILSETDSFFECDSVKEKYTDSFKSLFQFLKYKFPDLTYIIVYGELFGGTQINQDILYGPELDFIAFDFYAKFKSGDEQWFTYNEYREYLAKFKIPYNKLLFQGSWEEALAYPNDFETKVAQTGHGEGQITEGVVIKPAKQILLKGHKIMIKNKNAKFCERKRNPTARKKIAPNVSPELMEVSDYINKERLTNVVSKMGLLENSKKYLGLVMDEFCGDIMEEYQKDHENLTKKELKIVNKIMGAQAIRLVREHLNNL